jgi:ABC-type transporter Mla MlaB component
MPSHTFALPGELTIFTAAETRDTLLAWLGQIEHDATILLSADQVGDVDGAGVQLLCSLAALLDRQGRSWSIGDPTALLTRSCATLGLADWLNHVQQPGAGQ